MTVADDNLRGLSCCLLEKIGLSLHVNGMPVDYSHAKSMLNSFFFQAAKRIENIVCCKDLVAIKGLANSPNG